MQKVNQTYKIAPADTYDVNNLPREPLSLIYLFLALGIGLVLAWVVVGVMKSQLRSVAFQENAASYVRAGNPVPLPREL